MVKETRWKGSKARSPGAGFNLHYHGVDIKRNGVGKDCCKRGKKGH